MCSNGRSTGDISDIEALMLDKKEDINMVNDNIEIYKSFIRKLFEYYEQKHDTIAESQFRKNFNKKMSHINRGIKGISRDKNKKGHYKKLGLTVKKTYLVYVYQKMIAENEIIMNEGFFRNIQKCPTRNMSGVNSFALLLPPYPMEDDDEYAGFNGCRHNCYYCPDQTKKNGADVNIARSYLLKEPAVQRGFRCDWDAYAQMIDRMNSLARQGHKIDKLELIIEGGTYTEYPMEFLREFHRDIFYAANVFFSSKRDRLTLREEIALNMLGKVRIIGLCIETRPDAITDEWIRFFRESGTTRIQLGVQHTNNRILKKINRGHTFEESCSAVSKLRNNCFKIDIHLMPDLPLSSPEEDKIMFDTIFLTNRLNPDQIKIYPCEVTPYTVIEKWHKSGRYTPYTDKDPRLLIDVVKYALNICPAWIRIPRIVRDIPLEYIRGGNKYSNLRQMITQELEKEGKYTKDIRSREIGRNPDYKYEDAVYTTRMYRTSDGGEEYFISLESRDKRAIFGFIRLRIPPKTHNPVFTCLKNKGLIRELHVYNNLMSVGEKGGKNSNSTQHRGTGKTLLKMAECIAWRRGTDGTAVITGEGVRSYYHKRGYIDDDTFVVKEWVVKINVLLYGLTYIIMITIAYFIYNQIYENMSK
jgi:ELP3 family radical SAM enzyme/protein acetyltransferase